jgi:FtsP/CotA-like multicopper oxidase with cupredoxin domain
MLAAREISTSCAGMCRGAIIRVVQRSTIDTVRAAALFLLTASTLLIGDVRHTAHAHDFFPDERSPLTRFGPTRALNSPGQTEAEMLAAEQVRIPGADFQAVELGRDLDGDGDPDEIHIRLEVVEVQEEVYPGEFITFWVFAPLGRSMTSAARLPSPTIRVEEGDRVKVTLYNTHYFPHTIHFHGTTQPFEMDGVPDMSQRAVQPGESFTYEFTATKPGTYWYHCHVQDHVHVPMGLAGMFIVEPNRPNNHFAHVVPGAGRIAPMAKATAAEYAAEYSLVYTDIDDRLNRIVAAYTDPREIEKRMHRDYDTTQRVPNVFLLNGRAFPFTMLDTPIVVKPDAATKLRVLNAGARTIYLHTHGHHPTLTHLDGQPVPPAARITRDTFAIGPGQRVDLDLRTDAEHSSGPGVWLMHDHAPPAASNKGINPGGDHTIIVYENFLDEDGLPKGHAAQHAKYFDPAYYQGKIPVFDPDTFTTTNENYDKRWRSTPPAGGAFDYPVRRQEATLPRLDLADAERHRIVTTPCAEPARGFRRIVVKAGRAFAREGEVFGFAPRDLHAERCEEVEIVLENTDTVRHDLMVAGLSPMVAVSLAGRGTQSVRFVTPDEDISLVVHCHVPAHDKVGMIGTLVVGKGSTVARMAQAQPPSQSQPATYTGVGAVVATIPRLNRLIVDHEEIPGFMAAMEMSYGVTVPGLLDGLVPGDRIRFTLDARIAQIIAIEVLSRAK